MNTNDDLAPEWDALLNEGRTESSADFHTRVMEQVQQDAVEHTGAPSFIIRVGNVLQVAVVLIGALAAGWQTLGFIVGLWATSLAF